MNSGLNNGGSGANYTGSYNLPANSTTTNSIWTVRLRSSSTAGKTIYAPDLTVTVIGDTGLTLTNATVTPTMLTASGGKITFSATATDTTAAISNVIAELYQDGNLYVNSGLSNAGSGNVYTGSYNLPANPTSTTSIWTVRIRTSSTAGKTIYAPDSDRYRHR